ncbi:MAG TPA: SDR family oxidoreductase, partial [Terriglobia bacterium]|nr:SDR family oxidoreductase [Terriglobia bacterium]
MTDVNSQFQQHEILVTGANGFLGKVLLGILIDRYPDFKHLHVLLRSQGELSAAQRFEKNVLASPAFGSLANRIPRSKISVWPGDVGVPLCGLDAATQDKLRGRVSLI